MKSNIRACLYALYIGSIVIMICDLITAFEEATYFYLVANAVLIFRIFGVFWLTRIIHFVVFLYLIIILVTVDFGNSNVVHVVVLLVILLVQFFLAIHLLCIRPGRDMVEKACHAGIHALLGIIIVIIFFWMCCFLINFNITTCCLEIFYMLCFLLIMLTPQFRRTTEICLCEQIDKEQRFESDSQTHTCTCQSYTADESAFSSKSTLNSTTSAQAASSSRHRGDNWGSNVSMRSSQDCPVHGSYPDSKSSTSCKCNDKRSSAKKEKQVIGGCACPSNSQFTAESSQPEDDSDFTPRPGSHHQPVHCPPRRRSCSCDSRGAPPPRKRTSCDKGSCSPSQRHRSVRSACQCGAPQPEETSGSDRPTSACRKPASNKRANISEPPSRSASNQQRSRSKSRRQHGGTSGLDTTDSCGSIGSDTNRRRHGSNKKRRTNNESHYSFA